MSFGNHSYPLPANEPVLSYAPGTPERDALKAALKECKKTKLDIPMYIGGKEVRTGSKVELRPPHDLKTLLGFKHRTFNDTDILYFVSFFKHHYAHFESLGMLFS